MRISYFTEKHSLNKNVGYGNAGFQMITTLQSLGHEVPFNDPTAPVQIAFCNPVRANWSPGQYRIQYTPWESTELPHGWLEAFNKADEVWATSEWVADVYRKAGVIKPIYVYLHGLNEKWKKPVKRERSEVLKFLHMGEPAPRKGGQMAFDAFKAAFGDRTDVSLTLKAYHQNYVHTWHDGDIAKITDEPNVSLVTKELFEYELIDFYYEHDVFIYPSYGEGFGLLPLQALATGMPVISTYEWAPYREFLIPIHSERYRSIWFFHPGDVFYPDFDQLVAQYKAIDADFDTEAEFAFRSTDSLYEQYDWTTLTENAWAHIVERFTEN